jgi:alpha-L-fucosidase 2
MTIGLFCGCVAMAGTASLQGNEVAVATTSPQSKLILWYDKPATKWKTEASPIGNGAMGGMVFGAHTMDRIQFNVDSLWEGNERERGAYQAFGDLWIESGHDEVTDYRRELDIGRGVVTVSYAHGGVRYRRDYFCSYPARTMAIQVTADKPGMCTARIRLTDMHGGKVEIAHQGITSSGKLENGLSYEARLIVLTEDGGIEIESGPPVISSPPTTVGPAKGNKHYYDRYDRYEKDPEAPIGGPSLRVLKANSYTILLTAGTDYKPDVSKGWRGEPCGPQLEKILTGARGKTVGQLRAVHEADVAGLMGRFSLRFGSPSEDAERLPMDQRLQRYKGGKPDPGLESLYCQFGRYLLVSSSRPGTLPANLQGVWNKSNSPPWWCDYHSNINIQMNYWPAESLNLAECYPPLFDWVQASIPVWREHSAKKYPKTRGWSLATENNIYGGGAFAWNAPANAWFALHFYEHYAFGLDRDFLRRTAYPLFKEWRCQN